MDLATVIGAVLTAGLILGSILMGSGLGSFLDVPSIMIVVGGTFGVGLIAYPLKRMLSAFKVALLTMRERKYDRTAQRAQLVELANVARKEGLLALEGELGRIDDPLTKKGLQLLIDGVEPELIETMLWDDVEATTARHQTGAQVFTTLATISPSLGLIGTLIGLVQMLKNMSDPSNIGPAMAVALLTTFYGALLANVVFTPVANKLAFRSAEERSSREATIKGLLGIATGVNPRILQQHLEGDSPPAERGEQLAA